MSVLVALGFFSPAPLFADEVVASEVAEVHPLIAETTDHQAVFFPTKDIGWIVGNVNGATGTLFKTDDGGDTWEIQDDVTTPLRNITCMSTSICLAVGDKGVVLRTTNGGDAWVPLKTGIKNDLIDGTISDGGKKMILIGEEGVIRRSVDGGATWKTVKSGTDKTLTSIHFVNAKTAWITGEGGVLLKSIDEGVSWKSQKSGTIQTLFDVHSVTAQNIFVVGSQGTVRKTTNSGSVWSQQKTNSNQELRSVTFVDKDHGIVVGAKGALLVTTNGGSAWDTLDPDTDATLRDVHCALKNFCVVVGDKGTVLLFDLSAGTFIEEEAGIDEEENAPQQEQPVQEEKKPTLQDLPDLTITSATPALNGLIFKVKNIGAAPTGSMMGMKASYQWLDVDGNPNDTSFPFTDGLALQPLASNGDVTVQIAQTSPPTDLYQKLFFQNNIPTWAAKLKVTVDGTTQLAEANETNNSIIIDRPTTNIVGVAQNSSLNSTLFAIAVKNEGPLATPANMKVLLRWLKSDGTTASGPNASTSIVVPQAINPGFTQSVAYAKGAPPTSASLSNLLFDAIPSDATQLEVTPGKDEFAAFLYRESSRSDNAILLSRPLPDLNITGTAAYLGTEELRWNVINTGQADAPTTFSTTLQWLNSDGVPVGPAHTISRQTGPALAPGATMHVTTGTVPANKPLDFKLSDAAFDYAFRDVPVTAARLKISVDGTAQGTIAEASEENNTREVTRPQLELTVDMLSSNLAENKATFRVNNSSINGTPKTNLFLQPHYVLEWLNTTNERVGMSAPGGLDKSVFANHSETFTVVNSAPPSTAVKLRLTINGPHPYRVNEENYENDTRIISRP